MYLNAPSSIWSSPLRLKMITLVMTLGSNECAFLPCYVSISCISDRLVPKERCHQQKKQRLA